MDKKIALLFPGQGAQYVKMGFDFYQNFSAAKEIYEKADDILKMNLSKVIFESDEKELVKTTNSQLAIFVTSIAIYEVLKSEFIDLSKTYACLGLSLGEYSALYASKKVSFEEILQALKKRALFMQEACEQTEGQMAAIIGLDAKIIESEINVNFHEDVWVANYNTPMQTVISGKAGFILQAIEKLKALGARKAVLLPVAGAFHSELMQSAKDKLSGYIENLNIFKSEINLIMNVTGSIENEPQNIKKNLIDQVTKSVRWNQSIDLLIQNNVDLFIEIGPGKTLTMMNRKIGAGKSINFDNISDLEKNQNQLR